MSKKMATVNPYANFLAAFMKEERNENRNLTFGEISARAALEWKSLPLSTKREYRNDEWNDYEINERAGLTSSPSEENKNRKQTHSCPSCGRGFKAKYRLRFHLRTCGDEIVCKTCNKQMKSLETLQKHERFVHNKDQSFMCPVCYKLFSCHVDLQQHYNIHEGVRYGCNECESTFSNKSNLLKHSKKYH